MMISFLSVWWVFFFFLKVMAGTTPNVHDFTDMSDDEKKSLLEMFLNRTLNVTDPSAESVD